ncbi:MAG: hypothetical protein QG655_2866 [Actinomycetota bacterium]|jgi:hypothetical protein|nr:hypothetical protein [Actinomycetota bacterium]
MITKVFGPFLLAGAAAAFVAFAPTAGATAVSECQTFGLTPTCANTGHSGIVTTPGINTIGTGYWPSDGSPNAPIWVLE